MQTVNTFVQSSDLPEIEVIEANPYDSLDQVLGRIGRSDLRQDGQLIFVEDLPAPIGGDSIVEELIPLYPDGATPPPLKLHVTRCRAVQVTVRFNGETKRRLFTPGAVVERVLRWAAIRAFGLSPRDASDHVLQLTDNSRRPDRDVHIGALVSGDTCSVDFDLVPHERVEG